MGKIIAIALAATTSDVGLIALSGKACGLRDWRSGLMLSVHKERRYAKETGVVDLSKLQKLKMVIQAIDDATYPLENGPKRLIRCSEPTVAAFAKCVDLTVADPDGQKHHRNVPACSVDLLPYSAALAR